MEKRKKHYDLFVIGAGSGGVRAARIAASHGAKVGVAESSRFGGTCVNVGCVPKKIFAYASDFKSHFEDAKNFGWHVTSAKFDWQTLLKNKDSEISRLNLIYENLLKNAGVHIHEGFARFKDPHTLEIDGTVITADKILIATGGKPSLPDIPGKEHLLSSDDMFSLKSLPKRAVIIGGGYIGVEFAHILSGLESKVSLVYRGDKLLKGFDDDVRETLVNEINKQPHIDLKLNTDISKVEKKGKEFLVHTTGGIIKTDLVLAATGRSPLVEGLNLQKAGVKTDKNGKITVNKQYQSSQPHIYAVGDVCNSHNLTPVALAEGHVLVDRLYSNLAKREVNYEYIPTAVFSSPPVSTVGVSEEQAEQAGIKIEVYKSIFTPLKHTISGRDEKTMMKLIVEKNSQKVIGCHMVGMDAPEIMQGFAVAMNAGAKKSDFDKTIGIHPTAAEEFVTMRTPLKPK
jgi:glutathione reductase (NADPH)